MALQPKQRLGPYEVLAAVGAGGMGEVYRARDGRLNRDVALKVLPEVFAADPDRMARFEREARVLGALNHPNIAAIYGLEEFGSGRALVMELVEGETLADRIAKGRISLDEALPIAKQVAEALEYAHDRGVIHRDLKPANIKVTADGTVKVLDFGLAKALMDEPVTADPRDSPTLSMAPTMTGVILGTAAYMSPEQAKGKPVDRRADIWAFGVVLYEMLTGKQLYSGETAAETLAFVMTKEPPLDRLPASTPAAIRNLLHRCLEKNVKQRLQHIGEARIAIEGTLSGTFPGASPTAEAVVALRLGVRERIAWIVAGAAILVALGLASIHFREPQPTQQPSDRFEIPAPEKSIVQAFKLSPDGRYVAIVAAETGRSRLWLRPLDSLQPQVLAGTEDATYPFWSSDSAFIGFFAEGKLKKIAVAGGPPQILCDAPSGRGGAWSSEGVILFTPNISGALYRVAAEGGIPTPVTKPRPGTDDSDRYPEFLPGGQRFLYLAQSGSAERTGIYFGSLDGAQPVRVLPDAVNAAYVPPAAPGGRGHLLFRRNSTLMALPFDVDRLRATGEMFPLAEQVGTSQNVGNAAFSASRNGVLVYRTGIAAGNRELAWVDRTGKQAGSITKPGRIGSSRLSPDEKTIALSIFESAVATDIWLQDLTRGVISRFTFGPGANLYAVWSSDGSRIAFMRYAQQGAANFDLSQKSVKTAGKEELLLHAGTNAVVSDWSPDGKYIVYSQYADKTNYDLWLLPLEGDRKPISYLQSSFNEVTGQFSPDGRWMAYASDQSGRYEVYVQPIPATGAERQISTAGGTYPRWRRDGKELFYVGADQKVAAVPVTIPSSPSGAFEVGAPQTLFAIEPIAGPAAPTFYLYQPAADGQRFLVNVPAGGEGAAAPPITVILNWTAGLKK
jgi:Tol biopolymer transport system component